MDDLLAHILLLLNQRPQQINTSLDIFVGLSFEVLLNDHEKLIEVKPYSRETAQDINNVSGDLFISFFLEDLEESLHQIRVQNRMQVLVVHEKIPNGHSECPEALKSEQIFGRIIFMEVGVHRFDDKGVLREQEGRFSVDAKEEKRVDCVDDLFPDIGVEGHDEVFDFRHHRVQLGPLDIVYRLTLVALLVVLS